MNFELIRLEQIGKGGFGVVYKVYDMRRGRLYALKVMYKRKEYKL